jgi:hypothetical protein
MSGSPACFNEIPGWWKPEERGDEETETESRGGIQGQGGRGSAEGRKDPAGVGGGLYGEHPAQIMDRKPQRLSAGRINSQVCPRRASIPVNFTLNDQRSRAVARSCEVADDITGLRSWK